MVSMPSQAMTRESQSPSGPLLLRLVPGQAEAQELGPALGSFPVVLPLPEKIPEPSWAPAKVNGIDAESGKCLPLYLQDQSLFSGQDRFEGFGSEGSSQSLSDPPSSPKSSTGFTKAPGVEVYTTVMVLNVPNHISMKSFMEKLNESKFAGAYNFCNIPRALSTGKNLGFAFVNFDTSEQAEAFALEWAGVEIFGKGKKLKTKPAKIQGIQANLQLARKSMKRKNTSFKPLLSL